MKTKQKIKCVFKSKTYAALILKAEENKQNMNLAPEQKEKEQEIEKIVYFSRPEDERISEFNGTKV